MKALATKEIVLIDEWIGCYRGGWKGVIVDEAFSHPAKVAFNLAKRIYEHAIDCGWIHPDDVVIDPFGGIGGCAFHGLMSGMRVVTCELEEKFATLSKQNRELWRKQYTGLPGFNADNWIILQGDSRELASLISEAGIAVSSPPYANSDTSASYAQGTSRMDPSSPNYRPSAVRDAAKFAAPREYGQSEGQLGAMKEGDLSLVVSSPPYAVVSPEKSSRSVDYAKQYETYRSQGGGASFEKFVATQELHSHGYGSSDGQLARLPEGDIRLAVSSPPFSQPETRDRTPVQDGTISDCMTRAYTVDRQTQTDGNLAALPLTDFQAAISSPPYNPPMSQDHNGSRGGKRGTEPSEAGAFVKYGNSEGQIEGLSMDGFQAAISSPPYERSEGSPSLGSVNKDDWGKDGRDIAGRRGLSANYGEADGQIGHTSGDTFWSASRTILEQLYSVLSPGAHAIFIVKAFVRDKKIVDFPAQWAQLCESVGFKLIHGHHAMLTEHSGTQGGFFGEDKEHKVKRVSFFRRLHEKKSPETAIEYENVLCFERP